MTKWSSTRYYFVHIDRPGNDDETDLNVSTSNF